MIAERLQCLDRLLSALRNEPLSAAQLDELDRAMAILQQADSPATFPRRGARAVWHLRRLLESLGCQTDLRAFVLRCAIGELFDLMEQTVSAPLH